MKNKLIASILLTVLFASASHAADLEKIEDRFSALENKDGSQEMGKTGNTSFNSLEDNLIEESTISKGEAGSIKKVCFGENVVQIVSGISGNRPISRYSATNEQCSDACKLAINKGATVTKFCKLISSR